MKKTALRLAIAWTIVFIVDLIVMITGEPPNWILVFCPLIILLTDRWEQYFRLRRNE